GWRVLVVPPSGRPPLSAGGTVRVPFGCSSGRGGRRLWCGCVQHGDACAFQPVRREVQWGRAAFAVCGARHATAVGGRSVRWRAVSRRTRGGVSAGGVEFGGGEPQDRGVVVAAGEEFAVAQQAFPGEAEAQVQGEGGGVAGEDVGFAL